LTLANKVTLLRIALIPLCLIFLLAGFYGLAAVIFLLLSLSDAIDGYIARKYNQVSELGKMLDRKITPTHINILEGSTLKRLPDISKASKLLGYSPKITLKEGLEKTFDWYKKEIKWCIENKSSNEYLWN